MFRRLDLSCTLSGFMALGFRMVGFQDFRCRVQALTGKSLIFKPCAG